MLAVLISVWVLVLVSVLASASVVVFIPAVFSVLVLIGVPFSGLALVLVLGLSQKPKLKLIMALPAAWARSIKCKPRAKGGIWTGVHYVI